MDLWGTKSPVVDFHFANLTDRPLARLEVDGQAIALGEQALRPEYAEDAGCTSRNYSGYAITRLDKPLSVRWQFAQANPEWHQGQVSVTGFGPVQRGGRPRSTSVDLFFQTDGSIAAEAWQLIDLSGGEFALRIHAPTPLHHEPPCGRARDSYNDSVKIIQE